MGDSLLRTVFAPVRLIVWPLLPWIDSTELSLRQYIAVVTSRRNVAVMVVAGAGDLRRRFGFRIAPVKRQRAS